MSTESFNRAGMIAIFVATMGSLSAVRAAEVSLEDELRTGLMAALGESFTFVSGNFGKSHVPLAVGWGDRTSFWFAKVQATAPGDCVFSYSIAAPHCQPALGIQG